MKILFKILKGLLGLAAILALVYFLGPKVVVPNLSKTLPEVTSNLLVLEQEIQAKEAATTNIKPGNASEIVWYEGVGQKTANSILYLHGWSASTREGDPLHREIATRYGCNLYLPRLAGHGLEEEEPMLHLTADAVIQSAKEAIAVAKQLGDKVIIMATSTGATLALHLVGSDPDIAGLLLYSPNIEIYDQNAKLLAGPWGLQLARWVKNSDYHEFEASELKRKYWTTNYRLEALTHLQTLVDHTMIPETFKALTRPVFVGYYYKNEEEQDKVVSVPAMLEMYEQLGTPPSLKRKVAFTEVGDHVMTSSITSKDLESVRGETIKFIEEVLEIAPVEVHQMEVHETLVE